MLALVRYQLAVLGLSQRYLAPVLVFVAVLATQYTEPLDPLVPEYAVSGGALLAVACWLMIAQVSAEDPVQRLITLSQGRRLAAVLAALVLSVGACCLVLTVASMLWSLVVRSGDWTAADLVTGVLAHLACAVAGIAIGLFFSTLVFDGVGWAFVGAGAAVLAVLLLRWIPVVNPMLRRLAGGDGPAVGPAALALAAATVLLALSAALTERLARRRI